MKLFNTEFRFTPSQLLEDLVNLQREAAVYGEILFEGTQESHFCRIPLTPSEIAAYVEAAVAYDEFLGKVKELGDAAEALERLSNAGYRKRVKEYNRLMESRGVNQNYCFAGFIGGELEDLVCGGRPDRYELRFEWPSTEVVLGVFDGRRGPHFSCPEVGILKTAGYTVGESGVSTSDRQAILRKVFAEPILKVDSLEYMAQWGAPGSGQRLRKLAETIASLVRNGKKRRNPPIEAMRDWENDLKWLKDTFYRGTFSWPSL